jgi:hypothetical protein
LLSGSYVPAYETRYSYFLRASESIESNPTRSIFPIIKYITTLLSFTSLKTPNLTDAMILVGPPRRPHPTTINPPERGKNRIGVYPQQPQAVIPLPDPVILDTHFGYSLASADGEEFNRHQPISFSRNF